MNELIAELKNDDITFNVGEEYLHVFYGGIWFDIAVREDCYILYDECRLVGYCRDCSSLLAAIYEY